MTIKRSAHVAWRTVADEPVILNLASKKIYGLSAGGRMLWQALDTPRELEELARQLNQPTRVAVDWLRQLHMEGLVEVGGELAETPYEPSDSDSPVIAWVEEVTRAVGQCMHFSGQNEICTQFPQTS